MELLHKGKIGERLSLSGDRQLHIVPLLEDTQIGDVSIDLRLGADFMVSIQTRKPYIGIMRNDKDFRALKSYFQDTRREIGDRFVLYPGQLAIGCTLEYIALPVDVYADVLSRSSYTRLGIHINTMVQPGFRGCFPLELFNHGNNPVELVVGSRICQARLFELESISGQHSTSRKYFGNVRPAASRAPDDPDLEKLEAIREPR